MNKVPARTMLGTLRELVGGIVGSPVDEVNTRTKGVVGGANLLLEVHVDAGLVMDDQPLLG